MSFLETPEEADLYDADRAAHGYVTNYTKVFALRPVVYAAWQQLNGSRCSMALGLNPMRNTAHLSSPTSKPP